MIIDQQLLDSLTQQAKDNPRLRQAYDKCVIVLPIMFPKLLCHS